MTVELKKLYYEDITVTDDYLVSPSRTITEAEVVHFAGLTQDYHPVHTDDVYAKNSIFGSRIAHGPLVTVIAIGLSLLNQPPLASIALLGINWKYKEAVKIGDTIQVKSRIASKRETKKPDRGIVHSEIIVLNQRGEVVQEGEMIRMFERREGRE